MVIEKENIQKNPSIKENGDNNKETIKNKVGENNAQRKTKKGNFIKISYTGYVTESNEVFDTTDPEIAKKHNLFDPNKKYEDLVVCIGDNNVIKGLDMRLTGLELNKKYEFEIPSSEAFGPKSSKLIKLIASSKLKNSDIKPFPGLQLNVDGRLAVVRSVSSGRVLLDFNHPLAGKDVKYEIVVKGFIDDTLEKAKNYIRMNLGINLDNIKLESDKLIISLPFEITDQFKGILDELKKKIISVIPEIKNVEFIGKKSSSENKNKNASANDSKNKENKEKETKQSEVK